MKQWERHLISLAKKIAKKTVQKFDFYQVDEDKANDDGYTIDDVKDNYAEKEFQKYIKWYVGKISVGIDCEDCEMNTDETFLILFYISDDMRNECEKFIFETRIPITDREFEDNFKEQLKKDFEYYNDFCLWEY